MTDEPLDPIPELKEIDEDYSIAAEADGDLTQALRLAGGHAAQIAALDKYEESLEATLGAEISEVYQRLNDLNTAMLRERRRIAAERDKRLRLIYWTMVEPFAEQLPRKKNNLTLAGGLKFSWRKNRTTTAWAKDPTDPTTPELVEEFARALPLEAQDHAIRLKPTLNKAWLKDHLHLPDEPGGAPILRWADEDGEVHEVPAVVTKTIAEEPTEFPVLVEVPPAEPITYTITYPDGRKTTFAGVEPEEEDDDAAGAD